MGNKYLDGVDEYVNEDDWRVKENSNAHYSFGTLNKHISGMVSSDYWLYRVYPKEIREGHIEGDYHIHDLGDLTFYCCGYSLKDIIKKGIKGISNIPRSKPAKHFDSILAQIANITTIYQNEAAGAVAFNNFDTLLAPFVKNDGLEYNDVYQAMQSFIFQINSNSRGGAEPAFSNITFDLTPSKDIVDERVWIEGKQNGFKYRDCQKEMDMINKAFYEIMLKGDADDAPFAYPIPTYNIHERFDWENSNNKGLWKMAGRYGTPYFSNFLNSDMNPEDARSMCPLGGEEKVLVKSTRGRGLEYSKIKNIYEGNGNHEVREIYSDGRFVKGIFNKWENQELIEVELENGHSIKMTKTHLNYIKKDKNEDILELTGEELDEGYYLPYSLNEFEGEGGSYDLGYFIGAYAGDGSLNKDTSVTFSLNQDSKKDVLYQLKEIAINYFGAEVVVKENEDTELVTLRVLSKGIVGICKDFVGGKGIEKHYTAKTYGMSKEFRQGVLQGHLDTDGGNRNRIYTSSEKMVESINMLTATLGTTTSIYKDERDKKITYSDNPNYAVLIYQLNRKNYGDVWFKQNNRLWIKIKNKKEIRGSVGYCFEVEDGIPMFTVGTTGILTHNCRLNIDKRELKKRGGGLFGSYDKTGSIGVVTINLPRIGYLSENVIEFYNRLKGKMELAKESLEIKREFINQRLEDGMFPAFKEYVGHFKNHFSTIGMLGMNEMCHNLLGVGINSEDGHAFSEEVLEFMREVVMNFQEETGNLYNLEATPAESTCYRLAMKDCRRWEDIYIKNGDYNKEPYYTNSCHLPVDEVQNLEHLFNHQNDLQTKFTGGTVVHVYLQNSISGEKVKKLVKKICENYKIPYFSFSPVYSICDEHGFVNGFQEKCPICGQSVESYQRITGYIRQVSKFNSGKKAEFYDRNQLEVE